MQVGTELPSKQGKLLEGNRASSSWRIVYDFASEPMGGLQHQQERVGGSQSFLLMRPYNWKLWFDVRFYRFQSERERMNDARRDSPSERISCTKNDSWLWQIQLQASV